MRATYAMKKSETGGCDAIRRTPDAAARLRDQFRVDIVSVDEDEQFLFPVLHTACLGPPLFVVVAHDVGKPVNDELNQSFVKEKAGTVSFFLCPFDRDNDITENFGLKAVKIGERDYVGRVVFPETLSVQFGYPSVVGEKNAEVFIAKA
jgi:hypothetical protein